MAVWSFFFLFSPPGLYFSIMLLKDLAEGRFPETFVTAGECFEVKRETLLQLSSNITEI